MTVEQGMAEAKAFLYSEVPVAEVELHFRKQELRIGRPVKPSAVSVVQMTFERISYVRRQSPVILRFIYA